MLPLLKWAGGKRRISTKILEIINYNGEGSYFEPFVGGGAILFELMPLNAICIDFNKELINFYNVVKYNHLELITLLKTNYIDKNDKLSFYEIRALDRDEDKFKLMSNVERAARFIYLNKTCYNGLWRVNRKGQNNVPFGRYVNPKILDEEAIIAASNFFNEGEKVFLHGDFEGILEFVNSGDLVYFDPPYDVESKSSEFVGYTTDGFDRNDQTRLKVLCDDIISKGAIVAVSNSNTDFIRHLYTNGTNYNLYELNDEIKIRRMIGSSQENRRVVSELLIIGRPDN